MAILTTLAGALSLLAPQQSPAPQPSTNDPFVHSLAFPRETKLLVSWNATAEGPWPRAIDSLPTELRDSLPQALDGLATMANLTPAEFEALTNASYSFGATSFASRDEIGWLGVADFGSNLDTVVSVLKRQLGNGPTDGTRAWTSSTPLGVDISFGTHEGTLVFSSDTNAVLHAIDRLGGGRDGSMRENIRFQRFLEQGSTTAHAGNAFASAYVDVAGILDVVPTMVPGPMRNKVSEVLQGLQLRQIYALGYIAHYFDDHAHEHVRICFPEPRKGLPSLFAVKGSVDPEIAKFVPEDTPSFSVFHLATDKLLDETFTLLSSLDANAGSQLKQMMSAARESMSIDVEKDVFEALGRRFVALQWPSSTELDGVLVVALRNPISIGKALRNTRQFRMNVVDGFEVYRHGSGKLSLALGDSDLLISSSDTRLQAVMDQYGSGYKNQTIAELLRTAPPGTSSLSWTDSAAMFGSYVSMIDDVVPPGMLPGNLRRNLETVLPALGEFTSTMTTDGEGLSVRSHSPLGTFGSAFAVGLTAAISATHELDPSLSSTQPSRRAHFSWRVTEIAAAIRDAGNANLDELVAAAQIDVSLLGKPNGDGTWSDQDYRFSVLHSDDEAKKFVVVAWPDESARGDVFACGEDCVPLVNGLLTHGAGIAKVTPRDVFLGGLSSGGLVTGWERYEATLSDIESTSTPDEYRLAGQDWADYQAIVAAMSGDLELPPQTLIGHLGSENPAVVGQAARAIAKLGIREGVEPLCERAIEIVDDRARRQVARAIFEFADERTLTTSRQMLQDPDPMIRALAAANVGKFKDGASVDRLVDILVRDGARADDPDRTQALISLADIADPRCLSAAAGCDIAGDAQGHALAYLFQQASPKLGTDAEVATLLTVLGHSSTMLRRYAIQRLGELRDANSATALEHRLAVESAELRPLLEVSLSAVRGPVSSNTASTPGQGASAWFRSLDKKTRNMIVAGSVGVVLLLAGLMFVVLRSRRRQATDWAAMAAPSEEMLEGEEEQQFDNQPYEQAYDEEFDAPLPQEDGEFVEQAADGGDFLDEQEGILDGLDPEAYGDGFDLDEEFDEQPQQR